MSNDHDDPHRKFTSIYEGPVIDNVDPKKLGRVRVRIPGICDDGSAWAMPLGMMGSGGPKLGGWTPPPIGAEVAVWFKMGDLDHPRYIAGFPGEGEAPDEVDDSTPEEAVQVPFVFNGRRFKIIIDERPGKARVALEDKKTGDMFEIDGVKLGLKLKSTAAMSIECDGALDIKASSVTINGRVLTPSAKPID